MNPLDLNTGVNTWLIIGIITLGLLIFISTIRSYINAQRSTAFLRVPGKLTELQYTGKTKQSKTGLFTRYEFVYEGKRHEAHRIAFFSIHRNQTEVFHQQFLPEKSVLPVDIDVYIDPKHPKNCVLIRGLSPKRWYLDLFNGALFLVASVFIAVAVYFSN